MDAADKQIVETLRREHDHFVAELLAANEDLAEHAGDGLDVYYDHESDELSVTIGPIVEAATVSVANTLFLRYDVDSLRIVGFGVLGLRAHQGENEAVDRLLELAVKQPGVAWATARALALA